MKNTTELRDQLVSVFLDVKKRKLDIVSAKVMISAGNSILKTAVAELEHNRFLGKKKEIKFLTTPTK